ncbi:hypothetical protein MS3_00004936 [Schistosoma haematobium]|uniref:Uncharacterized protein n=1 Tax=Schistosoma haematobium TaxID=6185 RepID=A0A922IT43_SCHHA|nr:hypothetical protein MS3_00004936 [Schistosoma haematobium]KAH9587050.1 hypothetical protein MS3_00004936 [Schistosoma haematobium]
MLLRNHRDFLKSTYVHFNYLIYLVKHKYWYKGASKYIYDCEDNGQHNRKKNNGQELMYESGRKNNINERSSLIRKNTTRKDSFSDRSSSHLHQGTKTLRQDQH